MMLTNYTDYGLRALMLLAAEPARVQSATVLSDRLGISRHHLAKILFDLVAGGYLASVRGAAGGVILAHPPEQIRLGEVVRYLARDQALVECFRADGGSCRLLPSCRLRGALIRAKEAFAFSLDQNTLADMRL
ncbi:MAG TPA: Rrf2 family transcriptional regulator [Acidisoma sp.]|jgi:Rrf2 family nitric oxide-sensitive transcriptional repressor|uniref:RrF2 family transcriptional regulator n=1 Tax=Acidisoma sp. TaxID=1872115 RepID=UPI002BB3A64A|nr:Rrf2 family transcriptional regulator [Acidisoma sp.]HTI00700.1 Rrf2 family transcriptional regulator [Acidisoma sp.]